MQSPPFPRYLVPPRSKYSPQLHNTLYVSDRFSVHHQEYTTAYTAIGQIHQCQTTKETYQCKNTKEKPYKTKVAIWYKYNIYHCCVYSTRLLMMGQKTCPKHVEFYSKNKFEELVHLVGFIVRILW